MGNEIPSRFGYIGTTPSDGTINTIDVGMRRQVEIIVEHDIPFLSVSGIGGVVSSYSEIINSTTPLSDMKAILTTENPSDDRYVFINDATSILTGNQVDIYYDREMLDILVLPKFDIFGGDQEAHILKGETVKVHAKRIAFIKTGVQKNSSLTFTPRKANSFEINSIKTLGSSVTQVVSLPGLFKNPVLKSSTVILNSNVSVSTPDTNLHQIISLGSVGDITNDGALPVHKYLPFNIDKGYLRDSRLQLADNLYLPLDF